MTRPAARTFLMNRVHGFGTWAIVTHINSSQALAGPSEGSTGFEWVSDSNSGFDVGDYIMILTLNILDHYIYMVEHTLSSQRRELGLLLSNGQTFS